MSKNHVKSSMTYPRIITPEFHQLRAHYKRLTLLMLFAVPVLFLANEFFFRGHLPKYRSSPESLVSLLILVLNGEIPYPEGIQLRNLLLGVGIVYAGTACLLPKWSLGPRGRILRSNQPMDLGELGVAQFHVKHRTQHAIFWVWHHILMLLPMAIFPMLSCSLVNLARS